MARKKIEGTSIPDTEHGAPAIVVVVEEDNMNAESKVLNKAASKIDYAAIVHDAPHIHYTKYIQDPHALLGKIMKEVQAATGRIHQTEDKAATLLAGLEVARALVLRRYLKNVGASNE